MTIVIIGASFSGITAALKARQRFPQAQIILLDKQATLGFLPSGLALYLTGQVPSLEAATFISEETLAKEGINCQLNTEVLAIQTADQQVLTRQAGGERVFAYDKLIIATGTNQTSPQFTMNSRVIQSKSLAASQEALSLLATSQKVAIIGGSQVGLEMAHALYRQGKELTIFEAMDSLLLKYFDADMLQPFVSELQAKGVTIRLNDVVSHYEDGPEELAVTTTSGSYSFDAAVLGLSLFPSLGFLDPQIACHGDQTIKVDDFLRTTAANVFAIGDCIQLPHSIDRQATHVPLVNNAIRTAELVVENLEAPRKPFVGSLRTVGTCLFGYYLASTGLTETETVFYDGSIATATAELPTQLWENAPTVSCKIVYNSDSQRILGVQLVSQAPILEKIDTFALAIQTGLTLAELRQKDYFFHPSFTPLLTVTNVLGDLSKDVTSHDY